MFLSNTISEFSSVLQFFVFFKFLLYISQYLKLIKLSSLFKYLSKDMLFHLFIISISLSFFERNPELLSK